MVFNVYCDETCHLEHDASSSMAIGAITCPQEELSYINRRIKEIKLKNGIPTSLEAKWTKVSPAKLSFYQDLIDYFFDEDDLHFRAVVIPNKAMLDHERFSQTHDEWYYKMYFDMLKVILDPKNTYEIYIDIKDKYSPSRANKLREVCCNSVYDFSGKAIRRIQPIRSEEVEIMQLVDLLTGAVNYKNRVFPADHIKSAAKTVLTERISYKSGYSLTKSTLYAEKKFNLLIWEGQ